MGIFEDSNVEQASFVFQGEEDHSSAAARRRPMRADKQARCLDGAAATLLSNLLVGDYLFFHKLWPQKLQRMPGRAEAQNVPFVSALLPISEVLNTPDQTGPIVG